MRIHLHKFIFRFSWFVFCFGGFFFPQASGFFAYLEQVKALFLWLSFSWDKEHFNSVDFLFQYIKSWVANITPLVI